jgi:hypothetical protein
MLGLAYTSPSGLAGPGLPSHVVELTSEVGSNPRFIIECEFEFACDPECEVIVLMLVPSAARFIADPVSAPGWRYDEDPPRACRLASSAWADEIPRGACPP